MPKKSKPKQRTNWKQRVLNGAEAYDVLSFAHASLLDSYNKLNKRAESAEKHIGELRSELYCKRISDRILSEPIPAPTRCQRFKSFLKHWYVELLCILVILGVAGSFAAFVWKQGG